MTNKRNGSSLRTSLLGVGMLVAVVAIMLWLVGVFRPKIGQDAAPPVGGRSIDGMVLVDVVGVRVPVHETAVGTVKAVHEAAVASKLLAKVVAVHVKAGQAVTKDEVLVELDSTDLKARRDQAKAAVDSARANRDQAKVEYDRTQSLSRQGAAAPLEVDKASNTFKGAEADLQRAEQALREAEAIVGYATVHSPLTGVVVDKKVEVGDTVQPGQVLATLYDPTRMQLVARVRESLAQRLEVGRTIPVQIDALDLDCHGQISEIVPEAESASRTFSVKVTGPCPPGVYAGMFGRLIIPLDEVEMLVVPQAAVRRIGQLDVVDVVEGGVLVRRSVQLGRSFKPTGDEPAKVQVLSGLEVGERVAVAGHGSAASQRGD
ncbi:MAG: efflux RND transporter periplasmic adaptor subunit [Phycisphaerae bacterium]|nr:efflux RND transporter periplasmic adaptor subunit [Phycisphaerae bacterium]